MNDRSDKAHRRTVPDQAAVSVILPTLAAPERRAFLLRAVNSALQAAPAGIVKVIVCVNGNRHDEDCIRPLQDMEGVELHRLPGWSLPDARAHGRAVVTTPFFCFLDDDDELLPGAISSRLEVLLARADRDLVAANGIRRTAAGDEICLGHLARVASEPLAALFEQNWLPSCGALFRTATIEQKYFDDLPVYAEWTWLAFRIAVDGKRLAVLNIQAYVINDTPLSLSKSAEYRNSYLEIYRRMLRYGPPRGLRALIRRRMAKALHEQSMDMLSRGDVGQATRLHLKSLVLPGGVGYVTYSRHIIGAGIRQLLGAYSSVK